MNAQIAVVGPSGPRGVPQEHSSTAIPDTLPLAAGCSDRSPPFRLLRSRTCPAAAQALTMAGSTLVCSSGGVVRQTISLEGHTILDALYASFAMQFIGTSGRTSCRTSSRQTADLQTTATNQSTNQPTNQSTNPLQEALLVVTAGILWFYFDDGQHYETSLPFPVRRIWPLPAGGILIERMLAAQSTLLTPPMALLYTMHHPLDRIRPVSMDESIHPSLHLVVYVSIDLDDPNTLVVLHHTPTSTLRVCSIDALLSKSHRDGDHDMDDDDDMLGDVDVGVCLGVDGSAVPQISPRALVTDSGPSLSRISEEKQIYNDQKRTSFSGSIRQRSSSRLCPIWTTELPFDSAIDSCFVAHNCRGEPVLWVSNRETTTAIVFELNSSSATILGKYIARKILPVRCTRRLKTDVLIFTGDHVFSVWFGTNHLLPCALPDSLHNQIGSNDTTNKRRRSSRDFLHQKHPASLSKHSPSKSRRESYRPASLGSRVVDITHSFDSTVMMLLSNEVLFQTDFSFYPQSSLVSSSLLAIQSSLSDDQFAQFYRRFIISCHLSCRSSFNSNISKNTHFTESSTPLYQDVYTQEPIHNDAFELEVLVTTLLSFLHNSAAPSVDLNPFNHIAQMEHDAPSVVDQDDWSWFMKYGSGLPAHQSLPATITDLLCPTFDRDYNSGNNFNIMRLYRDSLNLSLKYPEEFNLCSVADRMTVVLHAVYENHKLSPFLTSNGVNLGLLLCTLAEKFGWTSYVDHYFRDGINAAPLLFPGLSKIPQLCPPVDVFEWVLQRIENLSQDIPGILGPMTQFACANTLWSACPKLAIVSKLYNALYTPHSSPLNTSPFISGPTPLLRVMSEMRFSLADLDILPVGICLPFRESLYEYRAEASCDGLDEHQLGLLGRNDIATQRFHINAPTRSQQAASLYSESSFAAFKVHDIHQAIVDGRDPSIPLYRITDSDHDIIMKLRFSNDAHIKDVVDYFSPSGMVEIIHNVGPEMSEATIAAEQQQHLQRLAARIWPIAVGRGMYLAYSRRILPTECLAIPSVSIQARFLPMRSDHQLKTTKSDSNSPSAQDWAEFHAGVSTGMQVSGDSAFVDGSWMIFSQYMSDGSMEIDARHAGLIFGQGLNAHLEKPSPVVVMQYHLVQQNTMATLGILLGLGVSYIGTQSTVITPVLITHIPELHPPNAVDLKIAPINTSVSMLSYGLVYKGSNSLQCIDHILGSLCRQRLSYSDEKNSNSECYALSCGFALGFVLLKNDMHGGGNVASAVLNTSIGKSPLVDRLIGLIEGPDTELTMAPALISLTLAFLKTNDATIANRIEIPSSLYLLDFVRPDVLLLRILARSLILWDSIQPSVAWMKSLVPDFIMHTHNTSFENQPTSNVSNGQSSIHLNEDENIHSPWTNGNVHTSQAYLSIMAAACLCLGLKFAGSCDSRAQFAIRTVLDECIRLTTGAQALGQSYADHMRRSTARFAMNVVCTSLGVVMAGSGDYPLLKLFISLSERSAPEGVYGYHMALSMSIGFLFLGKGRLTLGNSNLAVAGLLCSLYPTFPSSPTDNRSHNQAFRHLWTLAIERRCLIVRDVDTLEPIPVQVDISVVDSSCALGTRSIVMYSPCIVPYLEQVREIKVSSPRYWPVAVNFEQLADMDRWSVLNSLWVKRKIGHLPYSEDPHGHNSILLWTAPRVSGFSSDVDTIKQDMIYESLARFFSADPQILSFVQHFCNIQVDEPTENRKAEFCMRILRECLTMDKIEIIQTYMWLYETINGFEQGTSASESVWSMMLVIGYYTSRYKRSLDLASGVDGSVMGKSSFLASSGMIAIGNSDSTDMTKQQPAWKDILEKVQKMQERNLIEHSFVDCISKRIDAHLDGAAINSNSRRRMSSSSNNDDGTKHSHFRDLLSIYLNRALTSNPSQLNNLQEMDMQMLGFGTYLVASRTPKPSRLMKLRDVLVQATKAHKDMISSDTILILGRMTDASCPYIVLRCLHMMLQ
ncbi:hypothetical protein BASA50_005482 [Batrachochytrium salamandrivorans]|uniref:Anaphase-promoting complex subunit 1 n=1 Tax=Batrachochytrium salamandrivorans TaxID=1357716 RepID=A0ABQ8FDS5_9FUNG|nr:hypothetical protein BASA62_000699 [Batrachochytrium salamandrivorans]KAH6595902.1 hypothetical protein BASA50_005482 [Batrachochytrium salamandrivorans]KAH9273817.1 hypothetical protein BASA83_003811 [Batrachochytrium salamandrivorans]